MGRLAEKEKAMKSAITILERELKTQRNVLASMKESNARAFDPNNAYVRDLQGEAREMMLSGMQSSARWYEQNAIPEAEAKIAELEAALQILQQAQAA
jgi:hypothetical protein